MCVCLSVREHISGIAGPIFTKFCVRILCGRGSVFLWRRCDTICTSGCMDDVTFARNRTRRDIGAESDIYDFLVLKAILISYRFLKFECLSISSQKLTLSLMLYTTFAGSSSVTTVVTVKRHSESRQNSIANSMSTCTSECRAPQVNNINVAF